MPLQNNNKLKCCLEVLDFGVVHALPIIPGNNYFILIFILLPEKGYFKVSPTLLKLFMGISFWILRELNQYNYWLQLEEYSFLTSNQL